MKTTQCTICGGNKVKKVRISDADGCGNHVDLVVPASDSDPNWDTILSVWCSECGIVFNPDV